ncbi:MAG: hypothetical protein QOE23_169, partial [Pseudonocardiales bacterium]|nr:hypothetical protein [Pseudonocardiales bacterium]
MELTGAGTGYGASDARAGSEILSVPPPSVAGMTETPVLEAPAVLPSPVDLAASVDQA